MKTYNPLNNKSNAVNYASINICPVCARRLTKECGCDTDMATEEWRAAYFAAEQIKASEAINADDVILARLPFDRDDADILTAARKVAPGAVLTAGDLTRQAYGEEKELGTRFTIMGGEVMELDSHLEGQYDEQNGDIDLPF